MKCHHCESVAGKKQPMRVCTIGAPCSNAGPHAICLRCLTQLTAHAPAEPVIADGECQCGEWSGVACTGSAEVTVEWMPQHLRASHVAAGNLGAYPANGARRIRVSRECADAMLETNGAWVQVLNAP